LEKFKKVKKTSISIEMIEIDVCFYPEIGLSRFLFVIVNFKH